METITSAELRLDRVSVLSTLGNATLIDRVSFTIDRPGCKVGIVGASGAGKTTLLRLVNRLGTPDRGQILWRGKSLADYPAPMLRQQIQMVPQEPRLLGMRVEQALAYPLQLQKIPSAQIQQRVQDWCQRAGVPEEWRSRQELELSVGQRQWVSLVRGLVAQPQILLLDEPTSALDPGRIDQFVAVLKTVQCTVLMVSHQLSVVEQLCDRILWIDRGNLRLDSPTTTANWSEIKEAIG
ncbi:MAG: ATP-binding cassette domain-containing protein [Acaryochloridaceae cyanobacterium RU_4_10]|nr:ATP-binding cassette domain-containing protein [Acaryochloridaceae cyanobacterium RU_4_10]